MSLLFSLFDFLKKLIKIKLGGVAQVVEQENHNLRVRGSNPFAAIFFNKRRENANKREQIYLDGWKIGSLARS